MSRFVFSTYNAYVVQPKVPDECETSNLRRRRETAGRTSFTGTGRRPQSGSWRPSGVRWLSGGWELPVGHQSWVWQLF